MTRNAVVLALAATLGAAASADAQGPRQPVVQPGPVEPDWIAILRGVYGLDMFDDLANPVESSPVATPGLFRKAGPGPVRFRPEMALGLEATIRGGFYPASDDPGPPRTRELWSYRFKNTGKDIEEDTNLPPSLADGSIIEFDPGDGRFGLYIANDQFKDAVFSEPTLVAAHNERLSQQPYKAMIYPYRDPATRENVPNAYLIGWEYSTNDDFQDVVCLIENVELLPIGVPAPGR